MNNDAAITKEQLKYARDLVKYLEAGNKEDADKVLGELARLHESSLYLELGKLTRELHDALNGVHVDSRVVGMAQHDLPDAQDRLNYVIHLTEQAANKTLTAVESTIPICEELGKQANGINDRWKRHNSNQHTDRECESLNQDLDTYLKNIISESSRIKAYMNDILIAQDFQDLSGQSIRRVISLVHEIEELLINFIRITGHHCRPSGAASRDGKVKLEGPQIPGKENADVMSSQDDVDDLLTSLGF